MTKSNLNVLKCVWMAVIVPAMLLSAGTLTGQTWTGNVSNSWHDSRNWNPETVPGVNATVTILSVSPKPDPVITQNLSVNGTLTISDNATLTVIANLRISGEIYVNDGILTVENGLDIATSGLLQVTEGNINVTGSTNIDGTIDGGAGNFEFKGTNDHTVTIGKNGRIYMAPSSPGNHPPTCDPNAPTPPLLSGGSVKFLIPTLIEKEGGIYGGDAVITFNESTQTQNTAFFEIHNGAIVFTGNAVVSHDGYLKITCKGSIHIEGNSTFKQQGSVDVADGSFGVAGDATFQNSGTLNAGEGDITFEGNVTLSNSGGINAGASTIHFEGGTFSNNGNFNAGTSTFIFGGEGNQGIVGDDITFYDLIVEGGSIVNAIQNVLVENDMTVDENGEFNVDPGKTLNVVGDVIGDPFVDTNRPYIVAIRINSPNSITAVFNEQLRLALAQTASNYKIENENGITIGNPSNPVLGGANDNEVTFTTGFNMVKDVNYYLIVNNIQNIAGREVSTNHKKRFMLSEADSNWEWAGMVSSDWNNQANWKKNQLPPVDVIVVIPVTPNNPVISSTGNQIHKITIRSGASLTIGATGNLTVDNNIVNQAGAEGLIIASDPAGTGSLIHNTNSVPATFQRYISGEPQAWQMISSPVTGQSFTGDLTPTGGANPYGDNTRYDFYTWYEPDTSWVYLLNDNQHPTWNTANGSNSFNPGRGYLVSYKDLHPTKSFEGNLNNGTVTVDVTKTAGDAIEFGQNLLGNPYPSSIDWKAASGWNRDDLATASGGYDIWIWSEINFNYGAYNSSSSSDEGTLGVGRYIAPNQGFFVTASQSGIVQMDNSVRVHNDAGNWLKSANSNYREETVKLTIESSAGLGRDEVVVEFGHQQNETGTRKKFSFIPSAPSLFIPANELFYSIRMVGDKKKHAVLPVSFKAGEAGNYTLTAGFPSDEFDFFELYDKLTGMRHNLKEQPTYSFQAAPKDRTDRFVLQVAPGHFADPHNLLPVNVHARNKTLHVDMRLLNGQFNCDVFTLSGQQIAKKILFGGDVSQIDIPVAATVVVVHISGNEGKVYKKVPVF